MFLEADTTYFRKNIFKYFSEKPTVCHLKRRRFHSNRSTQTDSTLPVEQVETAADIAPVTSAMHRKLTRNDDNLLSKF